MASSAFSRAQLPTPISLANGGTGVALVDPNADRIFFWDDSAGTVDWLGMGNSLAITTTTIDTIQDIRTTASPTFAGLALGSGSLTMTGSLGATGARLTKGWFTDLQVTNAIAGSVTGNAATVTTNANLTGHITSTGNAAVLGSFTSAQLATALTDETGSGANVFANTPTLVTPVLGAATATSINGNTFTTGTYTLTGTAGKTLNFTNTLTLSGTDSTTMTFPATSATVARTDAAQTFTGTQTFAQVITTANAITASGNAATVPVTSRHNIVTNNSAATLTITLTTASAVNMQMVIVQILDFSAVAQTITWVNTENSTVTAPVTSNGSTTLPLTAGFIYNSATSKWRCIASA